MALAIEIFAGGGGMAVGSKQAGADSRLLIDSEPNACQTLKANLRFISNDLDPTKVVANEVEQLNFSEFADIDLLLGGPPCQPFAQGGSRKGHSDNRNMFPETVRIISECTPRAFIFENVRGITTGKNRNFAELIRLQLQFPEFAGTLRGLDWTEQLLKLEDHLTSGRDEGLGYHVVMHAAEADH